MSKPSSVAVENLPKYFLIAVLILLVCTFLYFISPFFAVLIVAAVIAIDVSPFNDWLSQKLRFRGLASFVTLLLVFVVIVTPMTLFVTFITNQAIDAYKAFNVSGHEIQLIPQQLLDSNLGQWFVAKTEGLALSADDLFGILRDSLQGISSAVVTQTTNFFKQLSVFSLYVIMFFISLYYFLFDGKAAVKRIKRFIPMQTKYKDELFEKLRTLSKAIVYSVFGAAIVQGLLGGIGFYLIGIENAAFWGTVMALMSPVPYVGPAIVWGPTSIYLLLSGHWLAGTFLFLWGAGIVSMADNLVKPYLIGKSAQINPLIVLLTLLGGILVFGFEGLIYGPFLLTLMLGFLHIYELEYKKALE